MQKILGFRRFLWLLYIIFIIFILSNLNAQDNIDEFINQIYVDSKRHPNILKKNYEKITMTYITPW